MKTIQLVKYGDADTAFQILDTSIPECDNNEVLVRVECFGLNFADVMARRKLYGAAPALPCTLGYEVVGKIIATGDSQNKNLIGKRVLAFTRFGGYAQMVKVLSNAIVEINENDDAAIITALATQYCTAYYASRIATTVQPGDIVVQHAAAGGVGIALTQLCKLNGAKIIGIVSNKNKVEIATSNGCHQVIVSNTTNYVNFLRQNKIQPDVIFNSVAGKSFQNDLKLLNKGGRLVCYGAADRLAGGKSFLSTLLFVLRMKRILPIKLLMNSQSIIGINMLEIASQRPDLLEKTMHDVMDLYRKKLVNPIVYKAYSFTEIANAHKALENRSSIGKIAVFW